MVYTLEESILECREFTKYILKQVEKTKEKKCAPVAKPTPTKTPSVPSVQKLALLRDPSHRAASVPDQKLISPPDPSHRAASVPVHRSTYSVGTSCYDGLATTKESNQLRLSNTHDEGPTRRSSHDGSLQLADVVIPTIELGDEDTTQAFDSDDIRSRPTRYDAVPLTEPMSPSPTPRLISPQPTRPSPTPKQPPPKQKRLSTRAQRPSRQPKRVTGGIMKSYQLDGLEWLLGIHRDGLSGILADEMGLGKTVQTIALLAALREQKNYGPHLLVVPLGLIQNWLSEFQKWAPRLPVIACQGRPSEREEAWKKYLKLPVSRKYPIIIASYEVCMNDFPWLSPQKWRHIIIDEAHRLKNHKCRLYKAMEGLRSTDRLLLTGTPVQNNLTELWALLHFLMPNMFDDRLEFLNCFQGPILMKMKLNKGQPAIRSKSTEPTIIDSLHTMLRPFLLRRVKTTVKIEMPKKREYTIYVPLTTPQQMIYSAILHSLAKQVVSKLAFESVLGPRPVRLIQSQKASPNSKKRKRQVEDNRHQKNTFESPSPSSRQSGQGGAPKPDISATGSPEEPSSSNRQRNVIPAEVFDNAKDLIEIIMDEKGWGNLTMDLRSCCNSPYMFFLPYEIASTVGNKIFALSKKKKASMSLLEKARLPYEIDERLVTTSGKMRLLDQLLKALVPDGHKILIFSQFTRQLNLIERYATELREWRVGRIDGTVDRSERQEIIDEFSKNSGDTYDILLLSTRAGGQGLTLTAADTVIIFDSDWNPQPDLQSQDRAHRIGQSENVIIYRFASTISTSSLSSKDSLQETIDERDHSSAYASWVPSPSSADSASQSKKSWWRHRVAGLKDVTTSVEEKLLERAEMKRHLEKVVIRPGGADDSSVETPHFQADSFESGGQKDIGVERDVVSTVEVYPVLEISDQPLSESVLARLLDRSDEAYEKHGRRNGDNGSAAATRTFGEGVDETRVEAVYCNQFPVDPTI